MSKKKLLREKEFDAIAVSLWQMEDL